MFQPFFEHLQGGIRQEKQGIIEYLLRYGRKKPKHGEGLLFYCIFLYLINVHFLD